MVTKRTKSKGKAKPKPNGSMKRTTPARKGPRSQALPGMAQLRNVKLDHVCESISEERETKNAATTREKGHLAKALQLMHDGDVTVYKHAGVELTRVPGAEKLRVRLVEDDGDAVVQAGEAASTQDQLADADS